MMRSRTIREDNDNYPSGLGFKNRPKRTSWSPFSKFAGIGSIPSTIGGVKDRQLLPQIVGFIGGKSVKSKSPSKSIPIDHDDVSTRGLSAVSAQITKSPIFPLLDRPKPIIDKLKFRNTIIERVKLIGKFGLVGQALNKNIPTPQMLTRTVPKYGRGTTIANIPSVSGVISGPNRTTMINPQSNLPGSQLTTRLTRALRRGMRGGVRGQLTAQSHLPGSQLPARSSRKALPFAN